MDIVHRAERSGLYALDRKVLFGFVFAALALLLIGVLAFFSVMRSRADARMVDHTHRVLNSLTTLLCELTTAESNEMGAA